MMKKYGVMLLLLVTVVAHAAVSKPSLLFVVHAEQAIITQSNGIYHMTLAKPLVSAFTDRPNRQAFSVTAGQFVKLWQQKTANSFQADHPNAVMVAGLDMEQAGHDRNLFIKLSQPKLDASKQQLTFMIKPLNANYQLSAGQYQRPVVFVDNWSGCAGSGGCL